MKKALKVILLIITISAGLSLFGNTITEKNESADVERLCIPKYSGMPYFVLNDNVPYFSNSDKTRTDAFEYYSALDRLGRCGQAYANICPELEPTEERDEIGQIRPSGWHTVKYNGLIDGNYLYNRCHLIAYQLAGENANERNLITGTRYLNTCSMEYFETWVDNYVDRTGNHVLYRVTPVYDGDNLVASGVRMEGWSVEDDGSGICFNVYCYNVQPGIIIDYSNGDSRLDERHTAADEEMSEQETCEAYTVAPGEYEFVINTNSGKFHLKSCDSVQDMAEYNKMPYTGTAQELIDMGYKPCRRCLPEY